MKMAFLYYIPSILCKSIFVKIHLSLNMKKMFHKRNKIQSLDHLPSAWKSHNYHPGTLIDSLGV